MGFVGVCDEGVCEEIETLVDDLAKALAADFGMLESQALADLVPVMEQARNRWSALDARFVEALDASCVWARRGHRNATAMLKASW